MDTNDDGIFSNAHACADIEYQDGQLCTAVFWNMKKNTPICMEYDI